ncbi:MULTISPECIES: TraR/DksA family transcriptional regulator [unclassified Thalassotalea]|uniref:TraR/DksA family transcriptional regulator n=1 Tax=unclassified Thalassotalea TaxID=2614972 RepID=UPI0010810B1D|nr:MULTISPECIES: TraR/DksA family transcriptional regulator [unclassified Thalassotalea]NMP16250.1 TraR/DksA family transcriptional regulator [Thalassotalea sp. Y01]QBY04293.1 TraR/DksA family transcriptional regulator [Thalassotalea sp. HSM 43]
MIVAKLTQSLQAKKQELSIRLAAIEADFKKGRSQDFAEQCTESENDEVLDEIHQQTQLELQKIEQTLLMLQTEQYGICSNCGKAIDERRLEALPYAKTCIDCAK